MRTLPLRHRLLSLTLLATAAALPAQLPTLRAAGKLIAVPANSCDPTATHTFQCGDLRLKSTTLALAPFLNRYVDLTGTPTLVTGCGLTVDVTAIAETTTKLTTLTFSNYRVGTTMSLLTQAPLGSLVVQLFNPGLGGVLPVLQFGTLFLDVNFLQQYAIEIGIGLPLPRVFTIPNNPGLIGLQPHFQALVVDTANPLGSLLTNDACFTVH